MKTKLLIGLGVVVILIIGMGLGYQGTKTIAKDYFLKDLIPSATLDEKDAFVESVSLDGNFQPKKLLENTKKAKTIININNAKPSLITMYGWNGTVSLEGFLTSIPTGLLFPGTCSAQIWITTKPKIKNGIK